MEEVDDGLRTTTHLRKSALLNYLLSFDWNNIEKNLEYFEAQRVGGGV